jgi:hypothetical protein
LIFNKIFFFILIGIHFLEIIKNKKIYHIISNLITNLLIDIYFVLNYFFIFQSFMISILFDCYLVFSYSFLDWIFFYLSDLISNYIPFINYIKQIIKTNNFTLETKHALGITFSFISFLFLYTKNRFKTPNLLKEMNILIIWATN